jgi:ferredoxin
MQCKNAQYLLAGRCTAVCPAEFTAVGTGLFNRVCRPRTATHMRACVDGRANCQVCSSDNSKCVLCKNAAYLFNGLCASQCPAGTRAHGTGRFWRFCS